MSRGGDSRLTRPAELPLGNPAGLTPLDLATANMLGHETRDRLQRSGGASLRDALFDVIEPALASERCLVSFSGGRESAVLLACATAAARARGYADPVPATLRYPGPSAEREACLQERVVGHLGLDDWERVEIEDELELVGPYARRALADVGVLFPVTSYALLPLLDRARGGWLLAGGAFGDFFAYWRWGRLADVLARRRPPSRRELRQLALAAAPRLAREHLVRARFSRKPTPWLREDAEQEVERLVSTEAAAVPVRFHAALARQRLLRCYGGMRASLDALAASSGASLLMPFRTDACIAAAAAEGGRLGFGDRNQAAIRLAGDLLPHELLTRSNAVAEQAVLFGERTRQFVERWSGGGVDAAVVDPDVLRALWAGEEPPWASTMLFQLAFAHDEGLLEDRGRRKVGAGLTAVGSPRQSIHTHGEREGRQSGTSAGSERRAAEAG